MSALQQQRQKYNLPKSFLDLRKEREEGATARSQPSPRRATSPVKKPKPHVLLQERRSTPIDARRSQRVDTAHEHASKRGRLPSEESPRRNADRREPRPRRHQRDGQRYPPPQATLPPLDLHAHYQRQFAFQPSSPPPLVMMPQVVPNPSPFGDLDALLQTARRAVAQIKANEENEVRQQETTEARKQELLAIRARQAELRETLARLKSEQERVRAPSEYDPVDCCSPIADGNSVEYDPLDTIAPVESMAVEESLPLPVITTPVVIEGELASYMESLMMRYAPIKKHKNARTIVSVATASGSLC